MLGVVSLQGLLAGAHGPFISSPANILPSHSLLLFLFSSPFPQTQEVHSETTSETWELSFAQEQLFPILGIHASFPLDMDF